MDKFKITLERDGKKYELVQRKKYNYCSGCVFTQVGADYCPRMVDSTKQVCAYPCHQLQGSFVWKEASKRLRYRTEIAGLTSKCLAIEEEGAGDGK